MILLMVPWSGFMLGILPPRLISPPPRDLSHTLRAQITAYTIGPASTGKSPGMPGYGITSSGVPAVAGVTVAAPSWVPYGTRVHIPGFGRGIVEDRGGAIHGHHFDICVASRSAALQWGVQYHTITLHFPRKDARVWRGR